MTDEAALLDTIAAAPADDLPRLVYADWLEDRGDTDRAAFIRAHVGLARARRGSPEAVRLAAAAAELFRAHAAEWTAGLGELQPWHLLPGRRRGWFTRARYPTQFEDAARNGGAYEFWTAGDAPADWFAVRRGLVDQVRLFNRPADLSAHPVAVLEVPLIDPAPTLDPVTLGRVRLLKLVAVEHGADAAAGELASSPHWRNLRALAVDGSSGPAGVVRALGRSPLARRVRVLRVDDWSAGVYDEIADWPGDAGLEELTLDLEAFRFAGGAGTAGLAAVAGSPVARSLRRLVAAVARGNDDLRPLAAGPAWPSLVALRVHGRYPHGGQEVGFVALARSDAFPRVTDLRLDGTGFDDDAALELAASAWPARLRRLDLRRTLVTIAGLRTLAMTLRDGPLEWLDIRGCALRRGDVRSLRDLLGPRARA